MSEHITHTAVSDDVLRLARHSPEISATFKDVLAKHPEPARLGAMTRSGDKFSVELFARLRREWASRTPAARIESKLSFALGWRTHQAADRRFKPVYRELQPEHYAKDLGPASDVTVYHDIVVFREVYANGKAAPFAPSVLDYRLESHRAGRSMDVDRAQKLFEACWQNGLLENHTFLKTERDLEKWLKLLFVRNEPFSIDIRRYAAAYFNPNPDLMYRYIVEPNFYDRADGVIALARSIQRGKPDPRIDVREAMAAAPKESQYAQGVHRGYSYVLAASEFWEGKISQDEMRKRFHIGTSHLTQTEGAE